MDEKQIYIKDLPTKESPSSSDYLVIDDGTDTNKINYKNFKSNVTDDVVGSLKEEATARKQADEELSDSISKEKSQRLLNVTSLENNINALKGVTVLVGDGETKVFTVNHNLSTKDLIVQAYLISGQDLSFSLKRDLNSFEITFDEAPTDEVRVIYIALNKWVGFKLPTKLPIK